MAAERERRDGERDDDRGGDRDSPRSQLCEGTPRAALLAAAREDQRPGPLSLGSALERGDAIGRIGVGVRQDGQRVKRVVGRFHGRYSSLMS